MKRVLWAGVCALALCALAARAATGYEYDIRYVGRITVPELPEYCDGRYSEPVIGCAVAQDGSEFLGHFSTDIELERLPDGIYAGAYAPRFLTFTTRFGALVWDSTDRTSAFTGFRDPRLGGSGIGVVVRGGKVLGLVGGVYGAADHPYLDFFADAGPPFVDWDSTTPQAALQAWQALLRGGLDHFSAADDRGGRVSGTYSVIRAAGP
ncbi:MAG: hypothetical protein HY749_20385 [Gammaproteobacteria bacterium]|nr:hypothetical protein [Gammaproteobacteria bacterium]